MSERGSTQLFKLILGNSTASTTHKRDSLSDEDEIPVNLFLISSNQVGPVFKTRTKASEK